MNICFYFPWVNKYLEVDGKCIFNFFVVCQRALQSHPPSLHPLVVSVRVLTAPPPCWHLILPVALLPNNLKIQSCIVLINYGCMIMSIFPILDTMRVILSSIQCLTYSRFLINNNFKKVFIEYRLGEICHSYQIIFRSTHEFSEISIFLQVCGSVFGTSPLRQAWPVMLSSKAQCPWRYHLFHRTTKWLHIALLPR